MSVFAGSSLHALRARDALARDGRPHAARLGDGGYGPLVPVTHGSGEDELTLLLPQGFDFVQLGLAGSVMSDGHFTPIAHDGMAAFPGPSPGTIRLIRNHEDRNPPGVAPSGSVDSRYEILAGGGTSTLDIVRDPAGRPTLVRDFMSLSGTIVNCAGGPTPWGSWLSCEETTAGSLSGWSRPHGYVFEVPVTADGEVPPRPLRSMGRFVHEAAAVDPAAGVVYLTEDRERAGLYRFLPDQPGVLASGGSLHMLGLAGVDHYDAERDQAAGRWLDAKWIPIEDPDPESAEIDDGAVFTQGWEAGGARFARLEGCWWGNRSLYFVSTNGGDAGEGQVWEYRPQGGGGRLRLFYESPGIDTLSFPDNMTVSPRGSLLVCEDPAERSSHYLRGITRGGHIFPFCAASQGGEWAGATFSPDGEILFVNLQGWLTGHPSGKAHPDGPHILHHPLPGFERGRTVAIWGPWSNGAL